MRLQLTVQRQGLPSAQVLWDTGALRPNHVPSGASTTIAQLLEHINEIIPLEAEEWGLEDYAVEVHGFECLHFCSLNILKEDDRVTIRPLQTSDIRYRRVSGRHQISQDGKHLIDGVAFGRPFLRRTDRPPVKIPSRKRIRLTYDDEEDQDIASSILNTDQTLVRTILNDADSEDSEDGGHGGSYGLNGISDEESNNVDNDEYDIGEDIQEILTKEIQDITQDTQGTTRGSESIRKIDSYDGTGEASGILTRSRKRMKRNGLGLQGGGVLRLLEADDDRFAGEYHNPLLDQYYQDESTKTGHKTSKKGRIQKVRLGTSNFKVRQLDTPGGRSRQSSSASMKSVRFEGDDVETPATIREVQGSDSEDNEDFEPDAGLVSGSVESNKENVQPSSLVAHQEVSSDEVDFGSSASDAESHSSNVSSSSSSSSDISLSPSSSGSTSSSSSGKGSTSSSEGASSPEQILVSEQKAPDLRPSMRSRKETVVKKQAPSRSVPPEKGHRRTQKRNERRRVHKKMIHLKSIGVLPSTANLEDYYEYVESRTKEDCGSKEDDQAQVTDVTATFEAKRKSLLESLASGGIDIDQDNQPGPETYDNDQRTEGSDAAENRPEANIAATERDRSRSLGTMDALEVATTPDFNPESIPASSNSSKQRSRLDVASSRRLLFGSLGLRTPKNKEDEVKLREKIMENAKPVLQVQGPQEEEANRGGTIDVVDALDNSWRERINLKAVECCYEGVELSTPPFPFIQRWDPQQKGRLGNAQGGQKTIRGKKRKRNQKQLYQEEETEMNDYSATAEAHEVDTLSTEALSDEKDQHKRSPIHQTTSDDYQLAVDRQLLEDRTENTGNFVNSDEDLPNLPEDMALGATLEPELALPGAVIAFKQLDMSQETNWQPKVSEYRTAIINRLLEGNSYQISLARRDRPRKERLYDRETGERLYSKFEMPEYENQDQGDDDDGIAEVSLADMIEPKLIKGVEHQAQISKSPPTDAPEIERIDLSELVDEDAQNSEASAIDTIEEVLATSDALIGTELPPADLAAHLPVRIREEPNKEESFEVNEETRKEISLIIKDAGFRSNVHSDIERGFEDYNCEELRANTKEDVFEGANEIQSPRFNGFSSSPPAKVNSKHTPEDSDVKVQPTTHRMSSTNIVNMESSQPNEAIEVIDELDGTAEQDWEPEQIEDASPVNPTLHLDTDNQYRDGTATAVMSSSPSTKITKHTSNITKGRGFISRTKALFSAFDGTDSDEDLPTMESVFSTAQSRIDEAILDSDDAREEEATEPSSKSSNKGKKASTTNSRFTRRSIPVFSVDDVLASSSSASIAEADESDSALPKSGGSQPPPGSQIVDLTLSSDPVEPDGSEYEERTGARGLPRGPGRVQKTRSAGKGRRLQPKAGARKTRGM
ncbi:hypothetical protein MMC30_004163 [Trapelia coarctata]|nr:hypothetical protein [Trapelia coarctata]